MMPLLENIHDDQEFFVMIFIVNLNRKKIMKMETN